MNKPLINLNKIAVFKSEASGRFESKYSDKIMAFDDDGLRHMSFSDSKVDYLKSENQSEY